MTGKDESTFGKLQTFLSTSVTYMDLGQFKVPNPKTLINRNKNINKGSAYSYYPHHIFWLKLLISDFVTSKQLKK